MRPLFERIRFAPAPFDAAAGARTLEVIAAPPPEATALVQGVAGCSPYLAGLMMRAPALAAQIAALSPEEAHQRALAAALDAANAGDAKEQAQRLRAAKREAALAHALAEISGAWTTMEAADRWSRFADACVASAMRMALAHAARLGFRAVDEEAPERACGVVVLAMGKHGAFELNYSSDIDLVVLFDSRAAPLGGPDAARRIAIAVARTMVARLNDQTADGYVFRTDLRLRPDPGVSAAAISVAAAEAYYEGYGQNWERAAYIKARAAAGDIGVGEAFIEALRPFIWRKYLDFAAIDDIHAILRQVAAGSSAFDSDLSGFDLKRGPGGIRAIEFFAQTHQLIAGGKNPALRARATLEALDALAAAGAISGDQRALLAAHYCAHRALEHRIQMIADEQTHRLPMLPAETARLAAFCGAPDTAALIGDVRRRLVETHRATTALFEGAGAEPASPLNFAGVDIEAATLVELEALGFAEPAAIAAAVRRWSAGEHRATRTPRARGLLAKLLPRLFAALARAGDPDAAFKAFESFLATLPAGVQIFALLANRPDVFDNLVRIVTISPHLAREIARRPHLTEAMIENRWPEPAAAIDALAADLAARLEPGADFEASINAARRWGHEAIFSVSAQLSLGLLDPADAAARFSLVAEAALGALLCAATRETAAKFGPAPGALCVIAQGRLGAMEMTAASDIDIMFVYDGAGDDEATQYYGRLVRRAVSAIASPTEEGALYEVDMQLRPSGSKGPVAVSFSAFENYYRSDAWTWEKMALTKARAIAGDKALGARIMAEVAAILARPRAAADTLHDIDDMRERLYASRPARSGFDLKLARGGLVDIDFIVQAAILLAAPGGGFGHVAQRLPALKALESAGAITAQEARMLARAYMVMESVNQTARAATGGVFAPSAAGAELTAAIARAAGATTIGEAVESLAALRAGVEEIFERRIRAPARRGAP